jgi:Uma2 family endonuclease
MNEIIQSPPRTIMEVYKMLPEGTLAELIDNKIYMSPSPQRLHQSLSVLLIRFFGDYLDENNIGEIFHAPFDVYLDEAANAVQPDIFIVLNDNSRIIQPNGHIHGSPDLIIEILSPGNKNHDLLTKKNLYEKFGVKEYFIVDPETKEVVHYILSGEAFTRQPDQTGVLSSLLLNNQFRW